MKFEDNDVRAIARAIDKAIGYSNEGPGIYAIPTTDADYEGWVIGPIVLGKSSTDEHKVNEGGLVAQHFAKPPTRLQEGRLLRPPLIEINAIESSRVANWPVLESGESERGLLDVRRVGAVTRMLNHIRDSLFDSLNGVTIRLISTCITQGRKVMVWEEDEGAVLDRLEKGWRLMLPKSDYSGLIHDLKQHGYNCGSSPYLTGTTAYLFDSHGVGVWRNGGEVKIVPWMNGRDLTFGISAYWLCGQAIVDPARIIGVDLGHDADLGEKSQKRVRRLRTKAKATVPFLD